MDLMKVQIMKYLWIVNKNSFLTVLLTFYPHGIASSTKQLLKKAKIFNSKNQAMWLVKTFLIKTSTTKIFPDNHFLQNASQEWYKKTFSEKSNYKTFHEI